MLQIIVLLAVSWILIRLFDKHNLSVLGFTPTKNRATYAAILFIVSATLSATAYILRIYFAEEKYMIAPSLNITSVLAGLWHQCRSVLTEELLCRGALLYILIKKTGPKTAIVVSSLVFAVLHWLNAGVWGNIMQMVMIFSFTFTMGLLLAYSYARTFSVLIPFAIHYGWNLAQNYIFPGTEMRDHIFVMAGPPPVVTISYLSFFTMLLFPKISVLVVDYFIIKTHKQVTIP